VAMDAGTYNVQKATCGQYCKTCVGATEEFINADPWLVPVSGTVQETATAQYNTGGQYNRTSMGSWSTGNASIATVSAGKVTAHAAGSTYVLSKDDGVPDYSSGCYSYSIECPLYTGQEPQAPGGVNELSCSPSSVTRASSSTCTLQGPGTASNWSFTSSDGHGSVTASSGTTPTTWSGTVVDSGMVTATANNSGATSTVDASLTVTPRPGRFHRMAQYRCLTGTRQCPRSQCHPRTMVRTPAWAISLCTIRIRGSTRLQ